VPINNALFVELRTSHVLIFRNMCFVRNWSKCGTGVEVEHDFHTYRCHSSSTFTLCSSPPTFHLTRTILTISGMCENHAKSPMPLTTSGITGESPDKGIKYWLISLWAKTI
jgi:hypothetical protein